MMRQAELEPVDRLREYFAELRRRGLDPRVAGAAERWAMDEVRKTGTRRVENLALQGVTIWREAFRAADAAVAEAKGPGKPTPQPTPPPAKSAADDVRELIRSAFAG
jgi:hypothetical protein